MRLKTYSALTGYVYRYHYEGWRPYSARGGNGAEFVFSVAGGTGGFKPVSVRLDESAALGWQNARGRDLSHTERYAVAKMALFRAFDARETPELMLRDQVVVGDAELAAIAEELDF